MIDVADLVKRYRKAKQNAVDGISFSVAAGEFFALLGPNGAARTSSSGRAERPPSGALFADHRRDGRPWRGDHRRDDSGGDAPRSRRRSPEGP